VQWLVVRELQVVLVVQVDLHTAEGLSDLPTHWSPSHPRVQQETSQSSQEMEEMLEMVALVHSAVLDRWVVPAEPEVPQVLVVRHMQEV
jgi:hypothetical protein